MDNIDAYILLQRMDSDAILAIANRMDEDNSEFVHRLAQLYFVCDSSNKARLEVMFADVFIQFKEE